MDKELLIAAGFKETFYPEQNESRAFWTKSLKASEMPYVNEHLVDQEAGIYNNTEVIVEVTPDNEVQMTAGRDYWEEPVPVDSDEGKGLLRDAGVRV